MDNPDVIFSTYGPIESMQLGRNLKKIYKNSFWIADFRDPIPWYTDSPLVFAINRRRQINICKAANAVTVVSRGMKDEFEADNIKRVHVLHNGFDLDDKIKIESKKSEKELSFVYTGNLYLGKRDLSPFIQALSELIIDGEIDPSKISIKYAGNYGDVFRQQVALLLGRTNIQVLGNLPRIQALHLQQNSDVLLHATWNSKGNIGVLTGKIYEYILAQRPVISLISGDLPSSEIAVMIKKAQIGFAYEVSNGSDLFELKKYIKLQYDNKMKTGEVNYDVDYNYISKFNYCKLTNELLNIAFKQYSEGSKSK